MSKPHGNKGHQRALKGPHPMGVVIGIRATKETKEAAQRAAQAKGVTLSAWCSEALHAYLK